MIAIIIHIIILTTIPVRLREEVQEMRRKWQEAVANREALASELTQVPLRIISTHSKLQLSAVTPTLAQSDNSDSCA